MTERTPEKVTPDELRSVAAEWGENRITCDDLLFNAAFTIESLESQLAAANAERERLHAALTSTVGAMALWGAEEDGIPEDGPIAAAYDNAVRLLSAQPFGTAEGLASNPPAPELAGGAGVVKGGVMYATLPTLQTDDGEFEVSQVTNLAGGETGLPPQPQAQADDAGDDDSRG